MSILISVLSQKRDTGKSTIARLLAVEAAKLGKHTHATSVTWNNRRMQINRQPALETQTYGAVAQGVPGVLRIVRARSVRSLCADV